MNEQAVDKNEILFSQLVLMFSTTAMQHLGKLVQPGSGKTEIDLAGAQFAIDILEMLEERTKGHRSPAENRMLGEALTSLRLNYVETADRVREQPGPAAPRSEATSAPETSGVAAEKPKETKPDGESARFHKTYG
ncbi:MAG: DUF1844 domain-containing protein [Kiritimatiellia bacterium]|nr:DUF1844 domain-containing protein [Kiritimatiellia bacterium]